MSLALRVALVIGAIAMTVFTVNGVRKSRMRIEDSLFWVGLAAVILVLSVCPQFGYAISDVVGFMAPVNFVFAFFIFVLTVKCFSMSRHESELENKVKELTQEIAIERLEHYERMCDDSTPRSERQDSRDAGNLI